MYVCTCLFTVCVYMCMCACIMRAWVCTRSPLSPAAASLFWMGAVLCSVVWSGCRLPSEMIYVVVALWWCGCLFPRPRLRVVRRFLYAYRECRIHLALNKPIFLLDPIAMLPAVHTSKFRTDEFRPIINKEGGVFLPCSHAIQRDKTDSSSMTETSTTLWTKPSKGNKNNTKTILLFTRQHKKQETTQEIFGRNQSKPGTKKWKNAKKRNEDDTQQRDEHQ